MLRKALEASRLEAEEKDMFNRLESKAASKEQAKKPEQSFKAQPIIQSQAVEPESYLVQKTELTQLQAPLKSSNAGQLEPLPPVKSRRRRQKESPIKEQNFEEVKP